MNGSIHINLRPNSKIYINGAVIRTDRRVQLELLNDATFLLDTHIMQLEETTTPLRQLYFVLQTVLMVPANKANTISLFESLMQGTTSSFRNAKVEAGLAAVSDLVDKDKIFEALKLLRGLFRIEERIIAQSAERPAEKPAEMAPALAAMEG